jgi:hypothetical protein
MDPLLIVRSPRCQVFQMPEIFRREDHSLRQDLILSICLFTRRYRGVIQVLVGSRRQGLPGKKKEGRLLVYVIPIIAVALTASVLALSYTRPPQVLCSDAASTTPAMDFTVALSIQVVNNVGNQTRFIATPAVGIPGGSWANSTYNTYGTNGRYPLCTDAPATGTNYPGYNTIHVRSTKPLNFALRDYFNVWGQPLGKSATDQTLSSTYVLSKAGYTWEMCIGNPTNPSSLVLGNWTYEPLVPGRFITLVYFNHNSSYPGCIG